MHIEHKRKDECSFCDFYLDCKDESLMSLKDIVDKTNTQMSRPLKLKRHVKRSHPFREMGTKCRYCKTQFENQELLELHRSPRLNQLNPSKQVPVCLKLPTKEKSLCSICGTDVVSGKMRSHLAVVHDIGKDQVYRYKCTDCEKAFAYPAALKRHLFRHHLRQNEADSQCRVCGREFPTKRSLKKIEAVKASENS